MSLLDRIVHDARSTGELLRVLYGLRRLRPDGELTLADLVDEHVARAPDHPALVCDERTLSWGEMDAAANRVAHWARHQGLGRGDVVALLMENRPEYVVTWLGLARIGAVTALLNTNLVGERLAHCMREADARHLVLGTELADACASALPYLEEPPTVWRTGASDEAPASLPESRNLDTALARSPRRALDPHVRRGMKTADRLFLIYTSGTTGLPKAANISHLRAMGAAIGNMGAQRLTPRDRTYVTLPLYHSAGGMMAMGGVLVSGGTAIIARRFSASRFWTDCVRHRATSFQYIGELCRYLLHSPEHPDERRHQLRVCVGNGLRPEVWGPFQERFAIPRIIEFYGATEGNVAMMNLDGKVGAVGWLPSVVRKLMGLEIVRFDIEREEEVRGSDGRCIPCATGDAGEAIARITKLGRFEGYTNPEATEKKILRDVFKPGDAYFRTGDLLRVDDEGYFYFVDRIGDTFRWKAENVSTSEVSEVISVVPGVQEANVYGVEIPGSEGRAGMAALVVEEGFDIDELARRVDAELAAYARPLFVRVMREMEVTGTFKQRKVELVKQGFDPTAIQDPLFFRHPEKGSYVQLDQSLHESIVAGDVRV